MAFDAGFLRCVVKEIDDLKESRIEKIYQPSNDEIIISLHSATKKGKVLINAGAKIITTAHGYSEKDILNRKYLGSLVEKCVFERIIVLSNRKGVATVEKIITDGKVIRHY